MRITQKSLDQVPSGALKMGLKGLALSGSFVTAYACHLSVAANSPGFSL
jgi:hypothetical protein